MSKDKFAIIAFGVMLLILALMTFSIGGSRDATADTDSYVGFTVIGRCPRNFDVVYDMETGVIYTMSTHPDNMGTMTLMVNPDGTPRVYEGFSKP